MDIDIGEFIRKHVILVVVALIILVVILGFAIVKSFNDAIPEEAKVAREQRKNQKFEDLNELFEYYESEYLGISVSSDKDCYYDISAKLKVKPYSGTVSNEEFYKNMINDIAMFHKYKSFVLIDEEKSIKIKVICENGEIKTYFVNGIEDYFRVHDEELALRKYKEFKETSMSIDAPILNELINKDWQKDANFGTIESRFNGYEIYYDEGIEVRSIQGKVFNIIFKQNYTGPVISGLTPQDTMTNASKALGIPTFQTDGNKIYGYKNKELYVFFGNNEISIYRNESLSIDELNRFDKTLTAFYNEEIDFETFMDELTEKWKDYAKYDYTASKVYISYPLKGFEIKVNYDNTRGFIFYNNFGLPEGRIENYLNNEDFMALLQLDCVYEAEKNRVKELEKMYEDKEKISEDFYDSNDYDICLDKDDSGNILGVYFISPNGNRPNRELSDSISTYAWVSDNYFVFSKQGNGLYGIDLNTGYVSTLLEGKNNYNITKSEFGKITCDNQEINIDV